MFDMFQLQELSVVICALADTLLHFEGNEFAPEFIALLKSDIPKSPKDICWSICIGDSVPDSQIFQNRDEMRNQKKELTIFFQERSINKSEQFKISINKHEPENPAIWKGDMGECSQLIWEWWKPL